MVGYSLVPDQTSSWTSRVKLTFSQMDRLGGRFIFGPLDMEQLQGRSDEILEKDLLKLRLAVP